MSFSPHYIMESNHNYNNGFLMSEKKQTTDPIGNIASGNTFTESQPYCASNAHQKIDFTPLTPPLPRLVTLTELKNQSEFIQCPHCLHYVYTKISTIHNIWEFVLLYYVIKTLSPIDISDEWFVLLVVTLYLITHLLYTAHKCPSCNKKIASYNKLEKVISITAPAITSPPSYIQ